MKIKRRSWILFSVALAASLLLSGCWLFGITLVLSYDIDDEWVSTDESFNSVAIDLTEEEDWKDNEDKLDEIYSVLFYGYIINHESTPATGQLYVYKDGSLSTVSEVQSNATLVLDGLVIPANDTLEVPLIHMERIDHIRDLVMEGRFHLYAIATNVPFEIEVFDATVVVIFAVEAIL
jgi:hypothetical protein